MPAPASDADRQLLIEFLTKSRNVIDGVVNARAVLFRESLRNDLERAWVDARQEVEGAVTELDDPTDTNALEKKLGDAGLSGSQLAFKMAGFKGAYERYSARGGLGLLNTVLGWVNTILQSLISALPGAEGIKELKDSIETELNDEDPTP